MKISIITATRNCAGTLPGCLAAVAGQSYADREHIVIDGTSTDNTLNLLKSHSPHLAVMVSEPDLGIYDALNKGLAWASGEVVGFLNADDVYADREVLTRIAAAFTDPAVEAVYGDLVYVASDCGERVVRYWRAGAFTPSRLRWGWMPPHPTLYLRRALYESCGGYDLRYRISGDYDMILRILGGLSGRVAYIPQVLVRMRLGGISNGSLLKMAHKSREDYRALREHRLGGLAALAWKNLSKLPQFWEREEYAQESRPALIWPCVNAGHQL